MIWINNNNENDKKKKNVIKSNHEYLREFWMAVMRYLLVIYYLLVPIMIDLNLNLKQLYHVKYLCYPIGFYGDMCNKCIALPGCRHGYCNNSFECKCLEGWDGIFCSERNDDFLLKVMKSVDCIKMI